MICVSRMICISRSTGRSRVRLRDGRDNAAARSRKKVDGTCPVDLAGMPDGLLVEELGPVGEVNPRPNEPAIFTEPVRGRVAEVAYANLALLVGGRVARRNHERDRRPAIDGGIGLNVRREC